ncbi:MAG: carbon-nitrogen hydrolase family protein [Steroidobacteraceae bacterium]
MSSVKVVAVQMNSGASREENLCTAGKLLAEAADAGARVAVLPENFSLMGVNDADRRAMAEPEGRGPVQDFLAEAAARHRMWIVAGTTPLQSGDAAGRVAPACLVYTNDGVCVARYDKIHLFDVDLTDAAESYRESAHMAPGRVPVAVDTPAGRLGLSICYDIRFPELFRHLVAEGCTWFTVPAAFTVPTGQAHWEVLLRARAVENLCYVVAAAQWGEHPNQRRTYGDSLICDYWGSVLARRPTGVGIVVSEFDPQAQAARRASFPALAHRVARHWQR